MKQKRKEKIKALAPGSGQSNPGRKQASESASRIIMDAVRNCCCWFSVEGGYAAVRSCLGKP